MCLDSQTGLRCISEPLVARCHGKDLTAACKCSMPSQMCAAGCCACPLKAKRNKDGAGDRTGDVHHKQTVTANKGNIFYDTDTKCLPVVTVPVIL